MLGLPAVDFLVSAGADLDVKNKAGFSALDIAVVDGSYGMAKVFLKKGVAMNELREHVIKKSIFLRFKAANYICIISVSGPLHFDVDPDPRIHFRE